MTRPAAETPAATAYSASAHATRARVTSASQWQVTADDLAAVPYRTAEDALRLVPGLTLVQHGSEGKGYQFFLRGFDAMHGSDFEVRLEGIPLNEWSNVHAQGYLDLGFVIPEAIRTVDVVKGPFELEQGAFATAGSAEYRLGVAPERRGLFAAYTLGTTNRHRAVLSYSPKAGDGRDFLMAEALSDDGYGYGDSRSIDRFAVLGRTRLLDSRNTGTLALLGAGHGAGFGLPGTLRGDDVADGRTGFYDSYDPAGRGLSARSLVALTHHYHSRAHHAHSVLYTTYRQLELLENYTGFLYDPVHGDRREQLQRSLSYGASTQHTLRLANPLDVTLGGGVRGEWVDQYQQRLDWAKQPVAVERDLDAMQTLGHGLLGLTYTPVAALQLRAGARFDATHQSARDALAAGDTSAGVLVAVSPRVGVHVQPLRALGVFANYGRGFRPAEARAFTGDGPPTTGFADELYNGGDPSMTFADLVELGARWSPNRYFGAQLAGFGTFIAKESVFDHVSGVNVELNATRRLGAELDLESQPLDWLRLSADVTIVHAEFVDSHNPVPFAPPIVGGLRAIGQHKSGVRAGLRALALAPRPLPHGATSAPLVMLDASVGFHRPHFQLDFALENLLNTELRDGAYHYASHWDPDITPSAIPVEHFSAGPPLNARLTLAMRF